MVAPLKVGIAGLGTVGAEVVRLIESQGKTLSARCGRGVRVTAVTARSPAKKRGLDLRGIAWAKRDGKWCAIDRQARQVSSIPCLDTDPLGGGRGPFVCKVEP